jgi:SOS-response transcriptional repressor LexA
LTELSQNIKKLMKVQGISVYELAHVTGIPQPTLHKIVTGVSKKPNSKTIKKLADYFQVKIQALTLSASEQEEVSDNKNIPIISWQEILDWLNDSNATLHNRILPIKRDVSQQAFSVISNDAIFPQYKSGAILVFDPALLPKDGSYILLKLKEHQNILFRQLIIDVNDKFIKPLNPEFGNHLSKLGKQDVILATLIQVIINYEEN